MNTLIFLNKYHGKFVDKTGDEYIFPVVDLDPLRKTASKWAISKSKWSEEALNGSGCLP